MIINSSFLKSKFSLFLKCQGYDQLSTSITKNNTCKMILIYIAQSINLFSTISHLFPYLYRHIISNCPPTWLYCTLPNKLTNPRKLEFFQTSVWQLVMMMTTSKTTNCSTNLAQIQLSSVMALPTIHSINIVSPNQAMVQQLWYILDSSFHLVGHLGPRD